MNSIAESVYLPYVNAGDYLKDYMALLSFKLHREVMLFRAQRGSERQESFLGLFISEQDIAQILADLHGQLSEDFPEGALLNQRIDSQAEYLGRRLAETDEPLPHQQLAEAFNLNESEVELVMMALAPEIDPRFSKVYGFLHDDVAKKNLSGVLVDHILGQGDACATNLRHSLNGEAPLIQFGLLRRLDDENIPLLNRRLKLENRVVNFLLGVPLVDEDLLEILQEPWSGKVIFEIDKCTQSVITSAQCWKRNPLPMVLEVEPAADVDVWLSLFCGQVDVALLCVDWQALAQLEFSHASRLLVKAVREAHLTNSLLHLRGVDSQQPRLIRWVMSLATPLICMSSPQRFIIDTYSITAYEVNVPPLSLDNCIGCWASAIPTAMNVSNTSIRDIAERYPIGARTIRSLCRNLAANTREANYLDTLKAACRQRVGDHMRDIAQHIDMPFRFDDLVLSLPTRSALKALISRQANRQRVFSDWGLGDVFRQAEGASVLFIGPSGTGKTMAAGVIANELGLDMYRVDLSGVVSKYIGETEKNLERIFSAAAESEVVLFIDEADALFGKRSEVKDAHDRYANIEVSYLLQKMEEHSGVVILASNFGNNIDDAFFRRFSGVIEFALPKVEERLQLWQKLYRTRAPLADDLDLEFLAERFEISGGHIKNCLVAAAFQAAEQDQPIDMTLLIRAVSREYVKIGKPISKTIFGDYYTTLRREVAGI